MVRAMLFVLVLIALALPAWATVQPFPASFKTEEISVADGAVLHVRIGGHGPAIVLLHGFGDTGDMWAPMAASFADDYTVVVPDLRGMGLSSRAPAGYDKKTQGRDIAAILDHLYIGTVDLVTHDIGNMVGYAFAAQYPARVTRFVLIDAPLPGIGNWDEIIRSPLLWHFNFRGPDVERLVAGRERIYLDRFWNELSADPKSIDEETRAHYAALYAQPGAMHAAFNQFAAFGKDAADNKEFAAKAKLTMPVMAIGAEKSFGLTMADIMRNVATDVTPGVIANSGHWIMEEQPAATIALVRMFVERKRRLAPSDIAAMGKSGAGPGTSGVTGITTTTLLGDPSRPGLYTISLSVPARTKIQAHTHRDDRVATVVSGTWYFGYGEKAAPSALKALPVGSYYTEPAGVAHFAMTKDEPVVVQITGFGPTDTHYVEATPKP